jgi:hypothetical protein
LKEEIKKIEDEAEFYRSKWKDSVDDYVRLSRSLTDKIGQIEVKLVASMKEKEQLKEENDLMRVYYKVDEEPSEEEKMKIHIDLRIHQLEMDLNTARNELIAERSSRNYISSLPSYSNLWTFLKSY